MKNSTYYEILGVAPHVGLGQLQAAYRFSKTLYSGEALATYGLLDAEERTRMLALVEEAYAVLSDPTTRREYENKLNAREALGRAEPTRIAKAPAGATSPASAPTPTTAPAPRPPSASTEVPTSVPHPVPTPEQHLRVPEAVNGATLRSLREQRGLSIDQIAALSKVGARFLRALEEDLHEVLPGRVFARGFLIEYARAIRVAELELVDRYLRHWTGR